MFLGKINLESANVLIDSLVQTGVTQFFIAPGSRSTSLTLAAINHSKTVCSSHFDERGLGFQALGFAIGSKKTAAIIVSSGTAVGNLLPAIMEAHHSNVSLLVLTADRPPELRDSSANQTTHQTKIFSPFVRFEKEILLSDPHFSKKALSSFASYAVYKARNGPVHLNVMSREPFFEKTSPSEFIAPKYFSAEPQKIEVPAFFDPDKKGLILIGKTEENLEPIFELSERLSCPIFADILSNGRSYPKHPHVVDSFDLLLKGRDFPKPDYVLHFGGRFVSKKVFSWLQERKVYANIQEADECFDPYQLVTHHFKTSLKSFCEACPGSSDQSVETFSLDLKISEDTEPGYMQQLGKHFPKNTSLFLANSMPIRDADNFFFPNNAPKRIFANRGVSGIDGNIATAVGLSKAVGPLIAVLGDLACLHDLNSLALAKGLPILFIVFNNSGGGIFSHLPVAEEKQGFDEFFTCKHGHSFEKAAKLFGLEYLSTFKKSYPMVEPTLLEIKTSTNKNVSAYQEIIEGISSCCQLSN